MVAERRFLATPENYAYLALLFSLLRPELQGYLKPEQDVVNPAIASITNPYNLTGMAFTGTVPYVNYGNNLNNFVLSKQAISSNNNNDPLAPYLDWHPNTQFDNNAVAMIIGDTQVRSHLDSESGYSSSDEARSPLSSSEYSSGQTSPRQVHSPFDDLSDLGAAGYTPESYPSLEDYVDLENLAEPTKGNLDITPDLPLSLKQEPDVLSKLLSPEESLYGIQLKSSPDGSDFPNGLDLGLETKDFNPFAVEFDQTFTNNSFHHPFDNDLESMINFDELASLDFNLPSDILTTAQNVDSSSIEHQLQNLIQSPQQTRNGSGSYSNDPTTIVSIPLGSPKKLPNIPSTSSVAVKKKAPGGKKKVPAAKKMVATKSKTVNMKSGVDISDDAIVDMAVNEFNAFLETLNEEQAKYVRDVRRRGKNKEAARVCRKRKLEVLDELEDELKKLKLERQKVLDERKAILEETATLKSKVNELESSLFKGYTDSQGRPLSSTEYSLFQGTNGTMYIGKNIDGNHKQEKST